MEKRDPERVLQAAHDEFHRKRYREAEQLYTRFIDTCATHRQCDARDLAVAYNNRGQVKYLRVDFREAVQDFTSAIQTDSRFEVPLYNRGLIRYRLGFFREAESDFRKTLELNPGFEDAKASLTQTLLDREEKFNRGC